MENQERKMDRRTFMKSTLAAGAGLALAGTMNGLAWGKTSRGDELADLPLHRLSKMIHQGDITSRQLVEIYLERIQK